MQPATITAADLYSLISQDTQLKRTAGTHGGEYHGPCPLCGGKDRLAVWPHAVKPGWWCRQCNKGGDAIQYLREQGYSYPDACRALGIDSAARQPHAHKAAPVAPDACEPPPAAWRASGGAFVLWAQQQLMSAPTARAYLHGRGLTDATIAAAGLGYNPSALERSRATWGLAPDAEHGDRFWLPAGIVIPTRIDGTLWKIQIRRDVVRDGQDRYKTVSGAANALYGADSVQPVRPALLVEGPFDALAVSQAAGDLIGVAACGTSGARRVRWLAQLALASTVLIGFDADAPGDTAAAYWLDALPQARRWRPWYADPAQMLQDGQDVRGWALAGLGGSVAAIVRVGRPDARGMALVSRADGSQGWARVRP